MCIMSIFIRNYGYIAEMYKKMLKCNILAYILCNNLVVKADTIYMMGIQRRISWKTQYIE